MVSKFQVPELEVKAEQSETEVKDKVKKKKKAKKTKVVIEISEENGQVKKAKLDFETDEKLKQATTLLANGSAKKSKKCKKKKLSVE